MIRTESGAILRLDHRTEAFISRFVECSAAILGDSLAGIYLHGSAAMGCFNPDKSDLDFLLVVREPMADARKREYMDMLTVLDREGPAKGIEMSIVTADVCNPFVYPTPFILHFSRAHAEWYRNHPEDYVRKMNGTDKDLAAHFTVIRSRGACLRGLPIRDMFGPVPEADYLDALLYDVADAKEDIAEHPMYMILNLARVLAFRTEGAVLSKREGGLWGLENLPPEYHPLVRAALHEYEDGADVAYDPGPATDYAEYMLNRII